MLLIWLLLLPFTNKQVWDKDVLTRDDVLGKVSWQFCPQQAQQAQQQPAASRQSSGAAEQQQPPAPCACSPLQSAFLEQQQRAAQQAAAAQQGQDVQQPAMATSGRASLRLELWRPHKRGTQAPSELEVEVQWQPSEGPGVMRLLGPVRFRQQLSPGFGEAGRVGRGGWGGWGGTCAVLRVRGCRCAALQQGSTGLPPS